VNRNWNGFLPQNELVKLQWAALEACQARLAQETFALLFKPPDEHQASPNDSEPEDELPELPFSNRE
jgi:hypothetical protein